MAVRQTRRIFLGTVARAGGAWAIADLVQIRQALAWSAAAQRDTTSARFAVLTPAEAEVVDAITSRILPAVEGRPGARDAGVVVFIDRALSTFNASAARLYARGIADVNRRARRQGDGRQSFAALAPAIQDELLRTIEKSPFFQSIRADTLVGTFGLPSWGGNRDFAGWHLIGHEHEPVFRPPFGYYDAGANAAS